MGIVNRFDKKFNFLNKYLPGNIARKTEVEMKNELGSSAVLKIIKS